MQSDTLLHVGNGSSGAITSCSKLVHVLWLHDKDESLRAQNVAGGPEKSLSCLLWIAGFIPDESTSPIKLPCAFRESVPVR